MQNDSLWRELNKTASCQLLGDAKKDLFQGLQLYLAETFLIFTNLQCKPDYGLFLTWYLGGMTLFKKINDLDVIFANAFYFSSSDGDCTKK